MKVLDKNKYFWQNINNVLKFRKMSLNTLVVKMNETGYKINRATLYLQRSKNSIPDVNERIAIAQVLDIKSLGWFPNCATCKHCSDSKAGNPCNSCFLDDTLSYYIPKSAEKEPVKANKCRDCVHDGEPFGTSPCMECLETGKEKFYEAKEVDSIAEAKKFLNITEKTVAPSDVGEAFSDDTEKHKIINLTDYAHCLTVLAGEFAGDNRKATINRLTCLRDTADELIARLQQC